MAQTPEKIVYEVDMNDLLSKKLATAEANALKFEGTLNSIGQSVKQFAIGAAAAFGVFAGAEFLSGSIEMYNEAAQAQGQLIASLESTRYASGLTEDALTAQAEALQRLTLYDDDATKSAQSLLLTFTNIRGEVFTNAIPVIQDMATKMGTDLGGAAVQVGKALNDPVKGITALQRVGVSFSETQKQHIAQLIETNRAAEAQGLILAELEKEFGGSARAAAAMGTGPLEVLKNQFNDNRERLGELIVNGLLKLQPAIEGLITGFGAFIDFLQASAQWVSENSTTLAVLATGMVAYTVVTNAAAIAQGVATTVTGLWTAAQWALNAAMNANPLGLIIIAVTGLVAAITYAWKNFEGFRGAVMGAWEVLKNLVTFVKEWVINVFSGLADVIAGVFTLDGDKIQAGMTRAVSAYAEFGKNAATAFSKGYDDGVKDFRADQVATPEAAAPTFGKNPYGKPDAPTFTAGKTKAGSVKGQEVKNINIRIENLIKNFTVETKNITESPARIKEMVTQAVTAALNDSQILTD